MAKPQSKTQKKIDNNVRVALTKACEQLLEDVDGFEWLTHQANYTNFPASLLITCVFDTFEHQHASQEQQLQHIQKLIQTQLLNVGVKLKAINQQIIFDNEQACAQDNDGQWHERLAGRAKRAVAKNRPH